MTWDDMQILVRDQLPSYTVAGVVDMTRLTKDVRKNFGLSPEMALKLVESLNVDSRRPGA